MTETKITVSVFITVESKTTFDHNNLRSLLIPEASYVTFLQSIYFYLQETFLCSLNELE